VTIPEIVALCAAVIVLALLIVAYYTRSHGTHALVSKHRPDERAASGLDEEYVTTLAGINQDMAEENIQRRRPPARVVETVPYGRHAAA
jgi:hypothetical protein